jgi:DNA-binding MarR family transcriptional regulator
MEDIILATALRTALSKMMRKLRKHMNAVDSLSIAEIDTLSFLYNSNEPLSPSELAELNKIKGQSMSEVLTRLKGINMINKSQSLADKRKFDISLTAHGKQIVEQTRNEREEWLSASIKQHLSEKEKEVLKEAVALIQRLSDF